MHTENIIKIVTEKLSEKKATNIKILNLKGLNSIFEYFIIASSSNTTHVKSLTDEIELVLKKNNSAAKHIEKDDNHTWVLLDCVDFVINIFHENTREFYNLDDVWADALEVCF